MQYVLISAFLQDPGGPKSTKNPPPPLSSAISMNSLTFFLLTASSSMVLGACFSIHIVLSGSPRIALLLFAELTPSLVISPNERFLPVTFVTVLVFACYFFALKELVANEFDWIDLQLD